MMEIPRMDIPSWKPSKTVTMKPLHIFGKEIIDQSAIDQLQNCMLEDSIGVLTADAHKGYAHPIGGAIAYKDHISVSGVGFDIGCGNMAVRTTASWDDISSDIGGIMNEIYRRISFGMGRPNNEPVQHPVIEHIYHADLDEQSALASLAENQLGTVGGGNHFVDLFKDSDGLVWIGVHFGSRGFGHKTASGFIALSQGLGFNDRGKEGSMDSKPILFEVTSALGEAYISAMQLAGDYAMAGREVVVAKVLEILGNPQVVATVHNHHNFAWKEEHFGEIYWVARKGCTPAFPGQTGFIGANMRDPSIIVEGVESGESREGLYSTVHGAGRILSRTQAAGKKKWIRGEDGKKRPQIVAPGVVDFSQVKDHLANNGIELRGAGADEAPECYKSLSEVISFQNQQEQTLKVTNILLPVGVAMAGDEYDPYKD